jgi:mutator protein MutT
MSKIFSTYLNSIEKTIFNFLHWLRKKIFKIFKIKTIGVRAMIFDQDKILLIKHRYGDWWVMPGGKIEKGEDSEQALEKELKEEVGLIPKKYKRFGIYQNNSGGKDDTVILFIVTDFEFVNNYTKDFLNILEVKNTKWFNVKELPKDISPATKRRIEEYFSNSQKIDEKW